jgi:3'-phosphoadenosine 5'-phosphosulfate sulfotransferase (PAPS reductase)/FAD synthetase
VGLKLYSLFSGGKDSITTAHYLASRDELEALVHLDTGIAVPDLMPHIRNVAERFSWSLEVYRTPVDYRTWVLRYGFPGPGQHGSIMNALKGRAIRAFKKAHPGGILASGVRYGESARRFVSVRNRRPWEGVEIVAPIWDWSTERVWAYVREHDLPLSPSYRAIHASGDCLCGAFAGMDEALMLRMFYPEVHARLLSLEVEVKAAGKERCRWGPGSGAAGADKQSFLCFECEQ